MGDLCLVDPFDSISTETNSRMAQCFPYPHRSGATYEALIESIKLQKENDKTKAERKKEKRAKKERKRAKKERKEKKKRKNEEKAKARLQKNPTEYQQDSEKSLRGSLDFKEVLNNTKEYALEQVERSDLTQEHGHPTISHKQSHSSDSTQNSNKRKRDDTILPDRPSGHGIPIKIRLLKKQIPDASKEALCSNSVRTSPQALFAADVRISTLNLSTSGNPGPSVLSSNRYNGVPATSGRENNPADGIALRHSMPVTKFPSSGVKNSYSQGLCYDRQQLAPSSAPKHEPSSLSDVEWLHPRRPSQRYAQEFATPSSITPPVSSVLPSNHLKRGVPNSTAMDNSVPMSSDKKTEHLTSNIPVAGQKTRLTKSEKKIRKKHAKYEKLMRTWVPPVPQAPLLDGEDWLSGSGRDSAASFLWQPCARFLVEADVRALPYTVPF